MGGTKEDRRPNSDIQKMRVEIYISRHIGKTRILRSGNNLQEGRSRTGHCHLELGRLAERRRCSELFALRHEEKTFMGESPALGDKGASEGGNHARRF